MTDMDMAIARFTARAAAAEQGNWVPACGGTLSDEEALKILGVTE